MAKSKGNPRRKHKRKKPTPPRSRKGWDGKGGYTKTDGASNICYYDKNHNLQYMSDTEIPRVLKLDFVWPLGSTVVGKTIKWLIDWHPPYIEDWADKLNCVFDAEVAAYLSEKKLK